MKLFVLAIALALPTAGMALERTVKPLFDPAIEARMMNIVPVCAPGTPVVVSGTRLVCGSQNSALGIPDWCPDGEDIKFVKGKAVCGMQFMLSPHPYRLGRCNDVDKDHKFCITQDNKGGFEASVLIHKPSNQSCLRKQISEYFYDVGSVAAKYNPLLNRSIPSHLTFHVKTPGDHILCECPSGSQPMRIRSTLEGQPGGPSSKPYTLGGDDLYLRSLRVGNHSREIVEALTL